MILLFTFHLLYVLQFQLKLLLLLKKNLTFNFYNNLQTNARQKLNLTKKRIPYVGTNLLLKMIEIIELVRLVRVDGFANRILEIRCPN